MRESPSCTASLRRFGVWRAAVALVAAAAIASMAAWGMAALRLNSESSAAMAAIAAVLAIGSAWLAASLARVDSGVLACRDGRWTFTADRVAAGPIESGELAVALDLGSFLLLTLTRAGRRGPTARRWLPVQRRGLETDWHALRCAVYSPPPVAPEALAADEPPH